MPETATDKAESYIPAGPISKAEPLPQVEPIAKAEPTDKIQTSTNKEAGGTAPPKPRKRRRLKVAHPERCVGCLSCTSTCSRIRHQQSITPRTAP